MASGNSGCSVSEPITVDGVSLVHGDAPTRKCRSARTLGLCVALVAVASAVTIAIALAGPRPSGVRIPDSFSASYVAYSKTGDRTKPLVTGKFFRTPAPFTSRARWHGRGTATMAAANGAQVMTATVVDDQGVVQIHDFAERAEDRELVETRCANAQRFPSLAAVGDALADAAAIDETAMMDTVGGGACEGSQWTRFLVKVGETPFVVCWQGAYHDVTVAGRDFYASIDVSRTVDQAELLAIQLPPSSSEPGATKLACAPLDEALAAQSRRLGEGGHRGRRLCEDCDPSTFPPGENCCRRRLDGSAILERATAPATLRRHREPRATAVTAECSRSPAANSRRCVFVHGLGIGESEAATTSFPAYWGDVHEHVAEYCLQVAFVHYKSLRTDLFGAAGDLSNALATAFGDASVTGSTVLVEDMLLFVHGAGNLVLAHAIHTGLCELAPSSRWLEIQSGRQLSALADWGAHFCLSEEPPTALMASKLDGSIYRRLQVAPPVWHQFVQTYPFCDTTSSGRRMQVGAGTLASEWAFLDATASHDYSNEAEIILGAVVASMCSVMPSNASPQVQFTSILNNAWDLAYPSYDATNKWSRCWAEVADFEPTFTHPDFEAATSFYDITCRAGNAWYSQQPAAQQPCSWYREMACVFGAPSLS